MLMNIKRFFLICGLLLGSAVLMAQSAAELQMAKQLAKQQGYSDEQIAAMASQLAGGGTVASNKVSNDVVDRNQADYSVVTQPVADIPTAVSTDVTAIFGHSLFKNKNLNFVPSYNVPTPENYRLSAGDEIVIDIWGDAISNITTKISPEGSVNIPNLGPVYISGQTVAKAEQNLKSYLSKIYSGIAQDQPTTFVKLALGRTKTVTINVVGDVAQPGSYTLPSLSTIASAMYLAGGPSKLGTVRAIKLYRNNKLKSTLDVYDFILNGKFDANVRLEDNDVVMIGPYTGVVTLSGAVMRPMRYEIVEGETIADLIGYAGGFTDRAYVKQVHVDRVSGSKELTTGATGESFDVPAEQFATFKLIGGDKITIEENINRFKNQIKIEGAVWRPGTYAISSELSNLKQLIQAAGGLRDDAHTEKGFIVRYGEDRTKEQVSFNLQNIIIGKENIALVPDDSVVLFSKNDLRPKQIVKIYGEVNAPGNNVFDYREGITIGDLILMAGGLNEAATLSKVEVARRVHNIDGESTSDLVAEVMHYNLLKNPADADVKLKPFDIVLVRRDAGYKVQKTVTVEGEVAYPGTYVVETNTVKLSDIISRAGGFCKDAYVKGAKLTRKLTKEEFDRLKVAMEVAKEQANDTTSVDSLSIGQTYTVAIDMDAAIANPGSVSDVILREGDIISVPAYNSTVKISGAVMFPNTVAFDPNKSYSYYISNAGGITEDGMKKKVYMVHMNGSVAIKGDSNFKVQPGTEIVVPAKDRKEQRQSLAAIMSIATSTASLAAVFTTIINQLK